MKRLGGESVHERRVVTNGSVSGAKGHEGQCLVDRDDARRRAREHLLHSADVKRQIAASFIEPVLSAADLVVATLRAGNKVMICGNGGSAADSQHIAAEFTNRFRPDLARPGLAAMALTTDTSFLTSHANDFGFETVFQRQVEALGKPGDVLIAISTSGDSENVVRAVQASRCRWITTIGLLGGGGGRLVSLVDLPITVPSRNTQHIQEAHLTIGHIISDLAEVALFGRSATVNATH